MCRMLRAGFGVLLAVAIVGSSFVASAEEVSENEVLGTKEQPSQAPTEVVQEPGEELGSSEEEILEEQGSSETTGETDKAAKMETSLEETSEESAGEESFGEEEGLPQMLLLQSLSEPEGIWIDQQVGSDVVMHATYAFYGIGTGYAGKTVKAVRIRVGGASDAVYQLMFYQCERPNYSRCSGIETVIATATTTSEEPQFLDFEFEEAMLLQSNIYYAFEIQDSFVSPGAVALDFYGANTDIFPGIFIDNGDAFIDETKDGYLQVSDIPLPPSEPAPTCCSSVLFLPGIQSSALKEDADLRWPSSAMSEDVARLALNEDGSSKNDIQVAGVLGNFVPGVDIYGEFSDFMNGLVAYETIVEWVPYAYDWRLPLQTTLSEGSEQVPGGEVLKLVEEVERLAEDSKSEKVAIVAHSMGGLLGKLLIKELEAQGKEDLIESFVMVGTPQLGTPQAVASLLHGHQHIAMEFFSRSHVTRLIGQNMQTPYDLLPSERYFSEVVDPVLRFNESADFTDEWRSRWGNTTDEYWEFSEFLTGAGVAREHPQVTNLAIPEVLRSDLYSNAETLHEALDTYVFPEHIRVVQIAGWGLLTLKGIEYKKKHLIFDGYDADFTTEGDNTVVYPSAISNDGQESYYFNLATYNAQEGVPNYEHRNLIGAEPINKLVEAVLIGAQIPIDYIATTKPDPGSLEDQLLVSTKSPVVLGAYDKDGNFTGINPEQDLTAETLPIEEEIPGSTFIAAGDDFYLFLPKGGTYTFKFKGTGIGPATVEVGTFSSDVVTSVAIYTDIPVTNETEASFVIDTEAPEETVIEVDADGDGMPETVVQPDGYQEPPTLEELIASLKHQILALEVKQKLKDKLIKKIEKLEKRIAKNKLEKASKTVMNLESKISKKAEKGKITDAEAQVIIDLLDQIEDEL